MRNYNEQSSRAKNDGMKSFGGDGGKRAASQGDGVGAKRRRVRVYKGGRPSREKRERETGPVVPVEALRQRGAAAGMPTDRLSAGDVDVCLRIQRDAAFGSALGRMMWVFDAKGNRTRRLLSCGPQAGREAVISDGMEMAATVYQRLWFAWQSQCGMPSRVARAVDPAMIRVDGARDLQQSPEQTDSGEEQVSDEAALKATARLRFANQLLDQCPATILTRKVIETVLIDDVFLPLLLDRPAALEAFRTGLKALENGLVRASGVRRAKKDLASLAAKR